MNGIESQLQPIRDAQLIEDIMQMVLDGLLADKHLLRHLFVLIPLGDQRDDFTFAGGERAALAALAAGCGGRLGARRVKGGSP